LAHSVLINTIIRMVLISIHPFAFRKMFFVGVAVLGLSSALCFADPVFMASRYTPAPNSTHRVESAKSAVVDPDRSAHVRPSLEPILARPDHVDSTTFVHLWDTTRAALPARLLRTTAASAGAPACLRHGIDPNFPTAALESLPGAF
jgi:hypothetical protein